jgi:hypothetical protein
MLAGETGLHGIYAEAGVPWRHVKVPRRIAR